MVIAFHGQQGSGKSSLASLVEPLFPNSQRYGIKKTFQRHTEPIVRHLNLKIPEDIKAIKQLELAISTWGETYINQMIWSNEFKLHVEANHEKVIIADDIRTEMNLNVLMELAVKGHQVLFFRLDAPVAQRKARVSVWRENGGYTENTLQKPADLPMNFKWVDLDTSGELEEAFLSVKSHL